MDHPILFSGPLVRALLAGRKTRTRRLVRNPDGWRLGEANSVGTVACYHSAPPHFYAERDIECPYGGPGDRLWVKETWRTEELPDGTDGIRFAADNAFVPIESTTEAADLWGDAHKNGRHGAKWRPSIFMRLWMPRIRLPLTMVRVERLQQITDEEIVAEGLGVALDGPDEKRLWPAAEAWARGDIREAWRLGWTAINGERAGASWDEDPWVWVLGFPAVEQGKSEGGF